MESCVFFGIYIRWIISLENIPDKIRSTALNFMQKKVSQQVLHLEFEINLKSFYTVEPFHGTVAYSLSSLSSCIDSRVELSEVLY